MQKLDDLTASHHRIMKDKAKQLNSVKQAEQICCYGTTFDRCASVRIVDYGFP